MEQLNLNLEIQVGDKVMIARKVEKEEGWENDWISEGMDRYLGRVGTVQYLSPQGIFLEEFSFGWPPSCFDIIG